ncbi:hypothetical protein E8E14_013778 [Neopestalotiopsis sp. 37M]|nr:hypothetical protein E8E14_013778 [Neopestalotiopsis sp. 37M]
MKIVTALSALILAVASVNAAAMTPVSPLHPLQARCHCSGHCCAGYWCSDETGESGECIDNVPYCDGAPCDWA